MVPSLINVYVKNELWSIKIGDIIDISLGLPISKIFEKRKKFKNN